MLGMLRVCLSAVLAGCGRLDRMLGVRDDISKLLQLISVTLRRMFC